MIRWRPYRSSDGGRLRERHEAQCRAMGAEFPYPDFSDPRYVVVEVAERDGELAGAVAAHATIEVMLIGAEAAVARAAVRERRHLVERLRGAGADEAHAFVPRRLLKRMEPVMRRLGFRRSNESYVAFYQEL